VDETDVSFAYAQALSEKGKQSVVGSTFHWWSGQMNSQAI